MSLSGSDIEQMETSEGGESGEMWDSSGSDLYESDSSSDSDESDSAASSESEFHEKFIIYKHPNETNSRDTSLLQLAARIKSIPTQPPSSCFPSEVLEYMKKNATPAQALKLMKVSKYFLYKKFPYTFIANVGASASFFGDNQHYLSFGFYKKKNGKFYEREVKVKDYTNNKLPDNLCIGGIVGANHHDDLLPQLISKTIACDLKALHLNHVQAAFDHFKFLTSTGKLEDLSMNRVTIVYSNGEVVPYEVLLDFTPAIKKLSLTYMPSLTMPPELVDKILELNLEKLELGDFGDTFDFESFLASLKKKPQLQITLKFDESDAIREKIHAYIDKLVAVGQVDCDPPVFKIGYMGIGKEHAQALEKLRNDFRKRNGLAQ